MSQVWPSYDSYMGMDLAQVCISELVYCEDCSELRLCVRTAPYERMEHNLLCELTAILKSIKANA